MALSFKTSAKRSDVRPLTLALSPEYRGEGTIEIPYPCDIRRQDGGSRASDNRFPLFYELQAAHALGEHGYVSRLSQRLFRGFPTALYRYRVLRIGLRSSEQPDVAGRTSKHDERLRS